MVLYGNVAIGFFLTRPTSEVQQQRQTKGNEEATLRSQLLESSFIVIPARAKSALPTSSFMDRDNSEAVALAMTGVYDNCGHSIKKSANICEPDR